MIPKRANKVDIIAYCEDRTCDRLPIDCKELIEPTKQLVRKSATCYFRRLPYKPEKYPYIKTHAFLRDASIESIVSHYDFVLRTDADIFLSPKFFDWKIPKNVDAMYGAGGYSSLFSLKMLSKISREFHWRRIGPPLFLPFLLTSSSDKQAS